MSGPSPETAALRMRSNCTSQPTSCTSTFTPVLAVKGATIFCRSSFGLGELGMVHSVSVAPFSSAGSPPDAAFLVELLPLSSPPQATRAVGASTSAVTAATSASLLGTGTPPLERVTDYKNVFGNERKETTGVCEAGETS